MGDAALQVHAGPRARAQLLERGLRLADVRVVPGAAGGPKGLALHAMDKVLFGEWLSQAKHPIHLVGSSVGAWRLALAALSRPVPALTQWALDYIDQEYPREAGRPPTALTVSRVFGEALARHLKGREAELLTHPQFRLHVITSRGRHLLRREGRRGSRFTTPLAYAGAALTNVASRRAVGAWLERVVFSDPREALPVPLDDMRSRVVGLDAHNLQPSILASCSIPFWLKAVHDIPGAPPGAYWDGGLTDYHLHLPYARMREGLVLYPHFQASLVPGWLDKGLKRRHRATPWLDNVVVLSPSPAWVQQTLPGGKIPDRGDFKAFGENEAARRQSWRQALSACERLGEELRELLQKPSVAAWPLV